MNDARARPSILDDVAVRAARDGARLQGDGRGQDPGPPPAVEYYNATMAKNAEYVVKDPAAVDKLGRQLVFSNLAKCVRPRFARASRPSTAIDSPARRARHPAGFAPRPPPDRTPTVLPTWTHLAIHAWLTSPPLTPPSTGFPAW